MQTTSTVHLPATTLATKLTMKLQALSPSKLATTARKRWLPLGVLAIAATVTLVVIGQTSDPIAINLSTEPLSVNLKSDKPAAVLAFSVAAPTTGAHYRDENYSNTNEYIGYYDAEGCYSYNNNPSETLPTGFSQADYKRFDRIGNAVSRKCTGSVNGFSGNFLNWATGSAVDMLRLALTGGDRFIDTAKTDTVPSLTILQRTVLPDGADLSCYFNDSSNFPAKKLPKNDGSGNAYWGAVPQAMITQAANKDIWVANVLNQIYFGTSSNSSYPISSNTSNSGCNADNKNLYTLGTLGDNPLTSDKYFYSRIQVCNISTTTPAELLDNRDYGLCTRYPNNSYKPIGFIQKYSEQLRLALFGYLLDQSYSWRQVEGVFGRYGGVLRAPVKFVGLKTFDENGQDNTPVGGNPKAEWDATTGVLKSNPDGDTTQITPSSGIINYINKLGRIGPASVYGRYKFGDPVGELYGEALRYLQGLQPTPEAYETTSSYASYPPQDGHPVYNTWTDPYGGTRSSTENYSCLKSNIVLIADAAPNDSRRLLTRTANVANNIIDFNVWNSVVTAFEKKQSLGYTDGQKVDRTTANNPNNAVNNLDPNIAASCSPSSLCAPLLAAQAYWAHTHDIRGEDWTSAPSLQRRGLRVKSYFFDVNQAVRSDDADFRQKRNQLFTAAKYGGFEADAGNYGGNPYNTWGNPFRRQDGTYDNNVWQDFANPGEASTFHIFSNPRDTLKAFETIFSRGSTANRNIAGSAAASKNFTQAGSFIYQGAFDTSDWSGDVLAIPIMINTNNEASISPVNTWSAATKLSNLASPASTRNIVVGRPGAASSPAASAFTWAAIDDAMKANLAKSVPSDNADGFGEARLNYLRGDNSQEGTRFRVRKKLLGDIVNSGVVYSGTPTASISGANGYSDFYAANASRTPVVFAGANDGMMHAFNANTGDELFGYIPSWMGPKLGALTRSTYLNNHQSYVDGSPAVAEAQLGTTNTAADWKTVLVSGTGAGGPGVFALDVTNPTAFSADKVLWEFTRADDPDLGYVVGRPQIVKMRTSAYGSAATYRWFAMVASGVNNYVADTSGAFTDKPRNTTGGNPALFLIALDKPVGTAWTKEGTTPNYYKITLPVDSSLSAANGPGLVNFRPIFGSAGEVTHVYMGDLHGKLWKLDFTLLGSTRWTMDRLSFFKNGSLAHPFYTARTAAGAVQPISMAPTVVAGPILNEVATSYVSFATGKYLESTDNTSTTQQTIYTLFDNADPDADANPKGSGIISGRGRLQAGTTNAATGVIAVEAFVWGRASSDTDTQRSGWYADFAKSGERVIANATVFGDNLIFGSLTPVTSGATERCLAVGGSGYQYKVNIDTGNGTFTASTVGLLGEPLLAEIVSAAQYSESSTTGRRRKVVTKQVIQQGSLGVGASTTGTVTSTFTTGRLSWRQINNYQDLKNAP